MGSKDSKQLDMDSSVLETDDDLIDSLIDEVSDEIDNDYKHEQALTCKTSRPDVFDLVTPIDDIHDLYQFQSQIGRGVSGSVYLAQSRRSFKQYALKRMPCSEKLNLESFKREVVNLNLLNHPNIVTFNDAYMSGKHYFVTTEFCSGGTLHERIIQMKRFSERDCVAFMKTILEAVHYTHTQNIAHRDLKLSNIVFDSKNTQHSKLKIIDFGESELITDPQKKDKDIVGSLHFLPPEITRTRRKHELYAGDMWAIGVIAYTLIEGAFPYKPKHITSIKKHVDRTPLKWNANIPISDACKNFIQCLLHKDNGKRLTAKQALSHPWITMQATDHNLGEEYFSRLQNMTFQNKLQRVMVNAVLEEMSETNKKLVLSHDGYEDDNMLINAIISGNTPTGDTRYSKQYSIVLKLPQKSNTFTQSSLDEMDIDGILAEIDAETAQSSVSSAEMDDTISTERFVKILRSSIKKYNIPQIVSQVTNDGTEAITYRKIQGVRYTSFGGLSLTGKLRDLRCNFVILRYRDLGRFW